MTSTAPMSTTWSSDSEDEEEEDEDEDEDMGMHWPGCACDLRAADSMDSPCISPLLGVMQLWAGLTPTAPTSTTWSGSPNTDGDGEEEDDDMGTHWPGCPCDLHAADSMDGPSISPLLGVIQLWAGAAGGR